MADIQVKCKITKDMQWIDSSGTRYWHINIKERRPNINGTAGASVCNVQLRDIYYDIQKNTVPSLMRIFKGIGLKAPTPKPKKAYLIAELTKVLEFEPFDDKPTTDGTLL